MCPAKLPPPPPMSLLPFLLTLSTLSWLGSSPSLLKDMIPLSLPLRRPPQLERSAPSSPHYSFQHAPGSKAPQPIRGQGLHFPRGLITTAQNRTTFPSMPLGKNPCPPPFQQPSAFQDSQCAAAWVDYISRHAWRTLCISQPMIAGSRGERACTERPACNSLPGMESTCRAQPLLLGS